MASIVIRDLDPAVKARLRLRAARHGRSMEEEARVILRTAVTAPDRPAKGLGSAIVRRFHSLGGVELELPVRDPMREPPRFK